MDRLADLARSAKHNYKSDLSQAGPVANGGRSWSSVKAHFIVCSC